MDKKDVPSAWDNKGDIVIVNDKMEIRKMVEGDVAALLEMSHSDAVYRYISPFLYRKSEKIPANRHREFWWQRF